MSLFILFFSHNNSQRAQINRWNGRCSYVLSHRNRLLRSMARFSCDVVTIWPGDVLIARNSSTACSMQRLITFKFISSTCIWRSISSRREYDGRRELFSERFIELSWLFRFDDELFCDRFIEFSKLLGFGVTGLCDRFIELSWLFEVNDDLSVRGYEINEYSQMKYVIELKGRHLPIFTAFDLLACAQILGVLP